MENENSEPVIQILKELSRYPVNFYQVNQLSSLNTKHYKTLAHLLDYMKNQGLIELMKAPAFGPENVVIWLSRIRITPNGMAYHRNFQ